MVAIPHNEILCSVVFLKHLSETIGKSLSIGGSAIKNRRNASTLAVFTDTLCEEIASLLDTKPEIILTHEEIRSAHESLLKLSESLRQMADEHAILLFGICNKLYATADKAESLSENLYLIETPERIELLTKIVGSLDQHGGKLPSWRETDIFQ